MVCCCRLCSKAVSRPTAPQQGVWTDWPAFVTSGMQAKSKILCGVLRKKKKMHQASVVAKPCTSSQPEKRTHPGQGRWLTGCAFYVCRPYWLPLVLWNVLLSSAFCFLHPVFTNIQRLILWQAVYLDVEVDGYALSWWLGISAFAIQRLCPLYDTIVINQWWWLVDCVKFDAPTQCRR